jgi:uroporphyrinogen decarboxylase
MVEGEGSKDYRELKRFCYNDPAAFINLLEIISETTLGYLSMQVQAGAECLMIFDSWAHQLAPLDFRDIVTPVLSRFFAKLRSLTHVPLIYYPGQSMGLYEELAGMQVDVVAVDWRIRLDQAVRNLVACGLDVTVQGNLDPSVLLGPESLIRYKTREVLVAAKEARAHIFNVGHGMLPHLSPDALAIVIDEVRAHDRLV